MLVKCLMKRANKAVEWKECDVPEDLMMADDENSVEDYLLNMFQGFKEVAEWKAC